MIKINTQSISLIITILFLSACGGTSDSSLTTNSTSTSTSTSSSNAETINDTTVTRAAVNIDDLTIKAHKNAFETKSSLYTSLNQLTSSFTKINKSVTDRMSEEMKLLNTLAKPFTIASNYSTYFSVNNNYNATTPAFVINKPLSNNYFLVSSKSKFYLQAQTIKTLFKDSTTLAKAWSRAITNTDKTKDLYLSLLEINTNGKITQITNSFLIKSATLKTY